MNLRRWLAPGIGVKRWLAVVFLGLLVLALAVAHVVRQVTQDVRPGGLAQHVLLARRDSVEFFFGIGEDDAVVARAEKVADGVGEIFLQ